MSKLPLPLPLAPLLPPVVASRSFYEKYRRARSCDGGYNGECDARTYAIEQYLQDRQSTGCQQAPIEIRDGLRCGSTHGIQIHQ
jgi:hypothetical protein